MKSKLDRKRILIFLALAFGIAWAGALVIYLTGGPGAQAVTYVRRLRDHGILDHRDLYILEQRGIGASGDLCPYFDDTNRAALWTESVYEAEVEAGRTSNGHRFLDPTPISIENAESYEATLEAAHVIVDVEKRRAAIIASTRTGRRPSSARDS